MCQTVSSTGEEEPVMGRKWNGQCQGAWDTTWMHWEPNRDCMMETGTKRAHACEGGLWVEAEGLGSYSGEGESLLSPQLMSTECLP